MEERRRHQETFIPPEHRAEADFGHIYVNFPERQRQVPVLLVTWSYLNCPLALTLPTERTEVILHGLVEALTFFGCVPKELWRDNPSTLALRLMRGRDRTLHPRYAALASPNTFTPSSAYASRQSEKPKVEHRVYDLQRRWATPVPQRADLVQMNAHLRHCCQGEHDLVSGPHAERVGGRFERDRVAALPIPVQHCDACALQLGQVDEYRTMRFDGNAYPVPRRWAFRLVTVKGYVGRIEIVAEGQVVAAHARGYGKGERGLDPLH